MLQRDGAAVFDRYASSLSPPAHLLYQILNVVPVCGGGSDFRVDASTWGRAGLLLRRINFVFLAGGSEVLSWSGVGDGRFVEVSVVADGSSL